MLTCVKLDICCSVAFHSHTLLAVIIIHMIAVMGKRSLWCHNCIIFEPSKIQSYMMHLLNLHGIYFSV